MHDSDLPLKAFAPRDAMKSGLTPWAQVLSLLLVIGVVLTTAYWGLALGRAEATSGNPWRSDPPIVTLGERELEAIAAMRDHPQALSVITYHEVSKRARNGGAGTYAVSPETFSLQMASLKQAGYRSVRLRDVADFVEGKGTLPPRSVLITFDDGHATDVGVADAILAEYGFNAVAFLITGALSDGSTRSYYLNDEDLATMQKSGRWEFGGHTHALHFKQERGDKRVSALDHLIKRADGKQETLAEWRMRVDADLAEHRRQLERRFGGESWAFAFPFGAFGQDDAEMGPADKGVKAELAKLLKKHGFTIAFAGMGNSTASAVYAGADSMALRRLTVRSSMDAAQLLYVLHETQPTDLQAAATLPWRGRDATCSFDTETGTLKLEQARIYGANCRPRANTDLWRDYRTSGTLSEFAKDAVVLWTLRDGRDWSVEDRLQVSFSRGVVEANEFVAGEARLLGRSAIGAVGVKPVHIDISVDAKTMRLRVDGRDLPLIPLERAHAGGVSIGISNVAGASLRVDNLSVEP
mgnify:CR=1 FL=1